MGPKGASVQRVGREHEAAAVLPSSDRGRGVLAGIRRRLCQAERASARASGFRLLATDSDVGRLIDSISSQTNGAKSVSLMNGTSIPIWAPMAIASSRPNSVGTITQPRIRL